MKVYFDVCCYNRPFDDCLDDRIELEANAIISIMYRCNLNFPHIIPCVTKGTC